MATMRIYDFSHVCLTQIATIMSSVDLDEELSLDQITDVELMYKYLYGHGAEEVDEIPEICNIVEEVLQCEDFDSIIQYSFPYSAEILRIIFEEIAHVEVEDDIEGEMAVPKEYRRATVALCVGDMPAKVRNKFMCEICEQLLFNNEHLKKHYLREHNKVQCKKCGVLLDADDAVAIRIHNRNCYIGFKHRNFVFDNFRINIISSLQNSIVTYICFPHKETAYFH